MDRGVRDATQALSGRNTRPAPYRSPKMASAIRTPCSAAWAAPLGQHFNNAHQVFDEVWHLYGLRVYRQGKSQAVNFRIAR